MKITQVTDQAIWDEFVLRQGPWSLFQSWLWGELQQQLGYPLYRFGLFSREKLIGVAQTVVVSAKRGRFVHVRHGPIVATGESKKLCWQELVRFLRKFGLEQKAWFMRISPLVADSVEHQLFLRHLGFQPSPIPALDAEVSWVLDLDKSETELLAQMRKTTRYLIRQAEKLQVKVEKSQDIESFMKLYQETAKRHDFVAHQGIKEEFQIFFSKKQVVLLLGSRQDKQLAGALILFFGSQAIYHHGASIPDKVPVTYLLQWRAIQEAKKRGMKMYNFWGIAPSSSSKHPWRGISVFKQGFGGREVRFLHAHDLPLSPWYTFPFMIEKVRKITRGY